MTFQAPTSSWKIMSNTERTCSIRLLWADMTAAEMAARLGTTKSAIIGFCWRHKLPLQSFITPGAGSALRGADRAPMFPMGRDVDPSTWDPIHGFAVEDNTCRWPVGLEDGSKQQFCAGRRHKGSYCKEHAAIAFRKAEEPRHLPEQNTGCYVQPGITIQEAVAVVRPAQARKGGAE